MIDDESARVCCRSESLQYDKADFIASLSENRMLVADLLLS